VVEVVEDTAPLDLLVVLVVEERVQVQEILNQGMVVILLLYLLLKEKTAVMELVVLLDMGLVEAEVLVRVEAMYLVQQQLVVSEEMEYKLILTQIIIIGPEVVVVWLGPEPQLVVMGELVVAVEVLVQTVTERVEEQL
jgi:hypothetical protein